MEVSCLCSASSTKLPTLAGCCSENFNFPPCFSAGVIIRYVWIWCGILNGPWRRPTIHLPPAPGPTSSKRRLWNGLARALRQWSLSKEWWTFAHKTDEWLMAPSQMALRSLVYHFYYTHLHFHISYLHFLCRYKSGSLWLIRPLCSGARTTE